jgi:hypothetical protein
VDTAEQTSVNLEYQASMLIRNPVGNRL